MTNRQNYGSCLGWQHIKSLCYKFITGRSAHSPNIGLKTSLNRYMTSRRSSNNSICLKRRSILRKFRKGNGIGTRCKSGCGN